MAAQYAPVEKVTAVEAVERKLRDDILTGRLRAGTRLPPERELAVALGVNRLTLRSALSRLVAAGLLVSQHGGGNRVLDFRVHCGLDRLPDLIAAFEGDPATLERLVADLLALRRALSADAVYYAAGRAGEADLAALGALAAAQAGRTADPAAFMQGDIEFTRAIVKIAGNLAFALAFNTVVQFTQSHGEILRHIYAAPEDHVRGYEALISLLALGDGALARELVRGGLEALDEAFLARLRALLPTLGRAPSEPPYER